MDRGEFPHLTDSQFESVRKMVGIFGGEALRNLAAATPAEQVKRVEVFDKYERGLIAHVQGLQAPVAELKPAQSKPLRLKVNPYEGKEGENLHFWVREVELARDAALEVELAMDATLISTSDALRAAFLPANYEYRQRFLACKQGKRELHECIQEMRVLAASLVGNPLPEHIKVTVFMDGLKVGPSRTQLFRVHANTMEEAIQIALTATDRLVLLHRDQIAVRLADGTVVNVPGVRMDLAVTVEGFDSTESFLVLDMDKYDLILGMPWFEKHEP
ncbi:Gag protein [Phytophthora palmivora]|uniref:Gag protein n=1 Tax=Phytophthora palmivora TaxID=4796 RepID=A0A2P4XUS1_9STRA|nr:Gag protein [Phytophthora palmivora]